MNIEKGIKRIVHRDKMKKKVEGESSELQKEETKALFKYMKAHTDHVGLFLQIQMIESILDAPLKMEPKEVLSWADEVESIDNLFIKEVIKQSRIREKINSPSSFVGPQNISLIVETIKDALRNERLQVINKHDALGATLPALEERAYRTKVDRLSIQFGEGSVRLTRTNIRISLWIPIAIFALSLLGGILVEAFKGILSILVDRN